MRDINKLLKDSWGFFTKNLNLLLGITLFPAFATLILNVIIFYGANDLVITVLTLVNVAISILAAIALILAINDPGKTSTLELFKNAKKYFWSYFGLGILIGIATSIGFLLFIIPGLIIMIWMLFAYFSLVLEDEKIIESMRSSREYVRDNWWAVFGRVLLLGILLSPFALLFSIMTEFSAPEAAETILGFLVILLFAPFSTIYIYYMYQDLKILRSEKDHDQV